MYISAKNWVCKNTSAWKSERRENAQVYPWAVRKEWKGIDSHSISCSLIPRNVGSNKQNPVWEGKFEHEWAKPVELTARAARDVQRSRGRTGKVHREEILWSLLQETSSSGNTLSWKLSCVGSGGVEEVATYCLCLTGHPLSEAGHWTRWTLTWPSRTIPMFLCWWLSSQHVAIDFQ